MEGVFNFFINWRQDFQSLDIASQSGIIVTLAVGVGTIYVWMRKRASSYVRRAEELEADKKDLKREIATLQKEKAKLEKEVEAYIEFSPQKVIDDIEEDISPKNGNYGPARKRADACMQHHRLAFFTCCTFLCLDHLSGQQQTEKSLERALRAARGGLTAVPDDPLLHELEQEITVLQNLIRSDGSEFAEKIAQRFEECRRVIDQSPRDPMAILKLGGVYFDLGANRLTFETYKRAHTSATLKLSEPGGTERQLIAAFNMARAVFWFGDHQSAHDMLTSLLPLREKVAAPPASRGTLVPKPRRVWPFGTIFDKGNMILE